MPERILDRETGGNTTYARTLASGLRDRGIDVGKIPSGPHPAITIARENAASLQRGEPGEILHFVADTGPLWKPRRPSLVTVHGVASRWISGVRTPLQERTWRGRVLRAIRSTDHVVTVSQSSARDISEVFELDPGRIAVIEHGIDVTKFAAPASLSPEVGQLVPPHYVLYLGNIEPRKNLIELVRAFDRPEVANLGVKLVIAGKPVWNARPTMEALESARNTVYLGFVSDDDRSALMQGSRAFAFPSLYEGFGFPVLEAMAAGAVVVTSDRGSLAEVAGPAIRFPALDEAGIAQGILHALTDETSRAACTDLGRDWASRFTWDTSVSRHVDLYSELLR